MEEDMDRMETSSDSEEDSVAEGDETIDDKNEEARVYMPGQPLEDGERLVCDESAYVMLHQAQTGAPCLSFAVLSDNLGMGRSAFPHTAYIVAGTQAAKTHTNK